METANLEQLSFIQITETPRTNTTNLFERFAAESGFDSFDDREILAMIISLAGGRRNTDETVSALMNRFANLKNILEAPRQALTAVKGVSEKVAITISAVVPLMRVWERKALQTPTRIGNSRDADHYCKSLLLGRQKEHFFVICLNAQCQVVGSQLISVGTLAEVSAYPRSIVTAAINCNAHSVLLCHNHPGGTCSPSPEDISSTLKIQKLLNALNILVLDHIIVAGSNTYSMIQHGDIDYRIRSRT